jgi:signal peptidase I
MQNSNIYRIEKTNIFDIRLKNLKILQFMKTTIEISLRIVLVIAFIITAFTVITSNTDLLLGIRSYTVLTGSMEPNLRTGSIIYTVKNLGYNLNDIITFKTAGDVLVTHRVVRIENNGEVQYVTKGDANSINDSTKLTADRIVGKTYFSIPYIGRIAGMLKTPEGLFTVVFLPAILIVLMELWNIKKEIEKAVERRILNKLKEQGGAQTHSGLWSESLS